MKVDLLNAERTSLFVDTFNSLCCAIGIKAKATQEGYGVILQLSNTSLRTLVLADAEDMDPSVPGWEYRAAGTFLAHIVRRGIHEAVERRTPMSSLKNAWGEDPDA